jgi:hypothetical protein
MNVDKGTHEKTVDHMVRGSNSVNGNPRYRVFFADGTSFRTSPDSQASYDFQNSSNQGDVTVTIDGRGNITHVEKRG